MKRKKLTVKMTVATSLSGGCGGEVKRKKWSFKKKLPLSGNMPKNLRRKVKKLTKFMGLFGIMLLVFLFSGCAARGYTEPEDIAVVSAMGFDSLEDGVRITMQTVDSSGGASVVKGEGETVSLALSDVYTKGSKRLELSHCAILVLGDGLDGGVISEIYDLVLENDEISDAVLLVGAHEALPLLSIDGEKGYDIASSMRSYPEGAGLFSKNRFYEIISEEKSSAADGVAALPYFYVLDGGYTLWGLKLYKGREERVLLDRREGALYLMMRGMFTSGSVEYSAEGRIKAVSVSECRLDRSELAKGKLTVKLSLSEELTADEKAVFEKSCHRDAKEIYVSLWQRYGDLFRFGGEMAEIYFDVR